MIDTNDMQTVVNTLFPKPQTIKDEATQRAFVNRSYYVIYHKLLAMIEQHYPHLDMSDSGNFGNTGSHNRVFLALKELMQDNGKDMQMVAYKFRDFLSKRHKADYKLDDDFSDTEYQQVLRYVEQIPLLIEKLTNK